ncbi:MAG: PD-(D/E)XK nuclease family protein [Chromatiaceae bacterium]|nr:PD-(D/E)XK nuclease family protein [Chromatiaceae bacterium]MCP5439427.1 PD-(D/E)XK nuclease family protein [Chromatiaceae bacterium]
MTWTLADLDVGTTLLTVNNRLATELRARYDALQVAAGRKAWPSADILPWHAWLTRQYQQLLDAGHTDLDLLAPAQERVLWQDIIERHGEPGALLRPAAAAESAQTAHRLCSDWQLDRHPLATLGGGETRTFLQWRRAFETELGQRRLLGTAELIPLITTAYADDVLAPPRCVVLSGFDALSPVQNGLFELMQHRGCTVFQHTSGGAAAQHQRVEAVDADDEIRLAATWARGQLATRAQSRIAIVSTQLTQQRRDLERVFTEILAPSAYLAPGSGQTCFNLSLGEPLSDRPLVAHALLALDLLCGEQPLNLVGQLLRSPFVGGHRVEWEGRALLDAMLRREGMPRINLHRLRRRLSHLDRDDARHCSDLAARLDALSQRLDELPGSDSPSRWAQHLRRLLGLLGWPGEQPLDSDEFQQLERFHRLFSELAALGKVRARMRLGEAVSQLRALARDTVFQAQSLTTQVQILGPLEAAGMAFDAVWLLGMHDQNWPPTPRPDPLLPTQLQRELGMPHASAARELEFAGTLIERLLHDTQTIIASHARSDGDRAQRVSPLVHDWPAVPRSALSPQDPAALHTACAAVGRRETMPPARASRAPAEVRGGAALLGAQANCPFRAVAQYRLGATPLEEPSHAADGAVLGRLIHELLQRVWQALQTSRTLAGMDDDHLAALVAPLAVATLEDIGRRRPDLFTERFRAIEAARLTRLVINWLGVERSRARAFEVVALEQDQVIELQGLQLSVRIDRVDRLDDGSLAIIDYKTGRKVSHAGWFDERLTEPQLPLYCLQGGNDVSAVVLARVRRDDKGCGFVGLSREPDVAPGLTLPAQVEEGTDWAALLARWQRTLSGLASEITEGRADPTPSPQACEYCPLGALCRVREMLLEDDGD